MRTLATDDIISEMILEYLDNPKTKMYNYYYRYSFTEKQMYELGNIFNVLVYIFFYEPNDVLPSCDMVYEYIQNHGCTEEFANKLVELYNFNDFESLKKFGEYIKFSILTQCYTEPLTLKQIGQIIKPPKVGDKFLYCYCSYEIIEVGKDNLYIMCKTDYSNKKIKFTLAIDGLYKLIKK